MRPQAGDVRDRFDQDGDELVRHFFSDEDLHRSPEEYAARNGHNWALFSLHRYRYHDPILGAWIRRLGDILSDSEELELCRKRFLNPEEYALVKQREREEI
jgi:hypothetical protein